MFWGKRKSKIKTEEEENIEEENIEETIILEEIKEVVKEKKKEKIIEKKAVKKDKSKTDVIRVRIAPAKKEILKKIAAERNISMSDIINQSIDHELEKFEYKTKFQPILEERILSTDDKLFKLKEKLYR